METRDQQISRIIRHSHIELGLKPMTREQMAEAVQVWGERLSKIPREWLERCYDLAIEAREPGNRFALTTVEMLSAWHGPTMQRELERANERARADRPEQCEYCGGSGLKYKDSAGEDVKWEQRGKGVGVAACKCAPA